jgi:predicted metal-dependent HD superfamily phosphohydrolase
MSQTETPEWLLAVWSRALVEAGATAPADEIVRLGLKLLDRWANPARRFHGLGHLIMVLEKIDELSQEASCPCLVRVAAFYHGAVLSTGSTDRKQRVWSEDKVASAELAEGQLLHLGLQEAKSTRVARLITGLGSRPGRLGDPDLAVLCDAERAILAADPRTYRAYSDALRAECEGEPLVEILKARIAVLRGWRSKDRLFASSSTAAWEDPARNNIEAELARSLAELSELAELSDLSNPDAAEAESANSP